MNASIEDTTVRERTECSAQIDSGAGWLFGLGTSAAARHITVLQVLPAMGQSGGVERGTVETAAAIIEAGGRALVASAGGPLEHDLTRAKAQHITLPLDSKNPLTVWANAHRLAKLIRTEKVDLVHARSRAPAWSAYWAAKKTGRPYLTTFHGTYGTETWLKRRYNGVMLKGELVIAISSFIAGHIRQHYGVPVRKMRVIHRGADLRRFDPSQVSAERVIKLARSWRLPDGAPVVMLAGRLTRWKGQSVLIDAMARLGRDNVRCILVGSDQGRNGYRRELEAQVTRLGLDSIVQIVDHCDDMPAAYMLTDLVISASIDPEAFGRVIVEGQAMGRPVIATDHGGARELVMVGRTGWLVPPGDPDELAKALAHALDMPPVTRQAMADRGIANVRENFSTNVMTSKTLDVYEEMLALRPPAR